MSISALLAVTMMIGTWLRLRIWRHTSMPLTPRQHHVEQHQVGVHQVEALERLGPSRGDLDAEPLRGRSPIDNARSDEAGSSSSIHHPPSGCADHCSSLVCHPARGTCALVRRAPVSTATGRHAGRTERELEPSPSTDAPHLATVVRRHVTHDRQPEPGAAGRRGSCPVDPVEALEDAVEVARRDAERRCPSRSNVDPRAVGAGLDHDLAADLAVLDRVLDQVGQGGHELAPIAERPSGDRDALHAPRARSIAGRRAAATRSTASAITSRRRPPRAPPGRRARSATARAGRRWSATARCASSSILPVRRRDDRRIVARRPSPRPAPPAPRPASSARG